MGDEKPQRDYKGWISIIIGACAVWVAYESFAWQKNHSDGEDATPPGTENTIGTDASGQHSTSGSTEQATEKNEEPEKPGPGDKGDKHDKDKKNKP